MTYTDIIKRRQIAAIGNRAETLTRFRANEVRLYDWIRRLPRGWSRDLSWKRAGSLCCGVSKTLQEIDTR